MIKIITALGNPEVNNRLRNIEEFEVLKNDIQYQDGILEALDNEKNINYLILSEIIPGENKIEDLIEKIKLKNNTLKIIIILENKKEELENYLYSKGIKKIFYNNQVEIQEIINLIKNKKEIENEELKNEINNLKEILLNKNTKENKKIINLNKEKNKIDKNKINNKKYKNEIISVCGISGIGKSIFSINLANSLKYNNNKILIIDFDVLNSSLHTILGLKKYPEKIRKRIKENNLINNKFNVKELVIKINSRIDLISGINLLFDSKYKISSLKIESILNELKKYYDAIIVDTSSECFFDYIKNIFKLSNYIIFLSGTNLVEIKKSKRYLNMYINDWEINKEKINILFNKENENSIDENILKNIFSDFKILGYLKENKKYNLIINKNYNNNFVDKKIKRKYIKISEKILKINNKNNINNKLIIYLKNKLVNKQLLRS